MKNGQVIESISKDVAKKIKKYMISCGIKMSWYGFDSFSDERGKIYYGLNEEGVVELFYSDDITMKNLTIIELPKDIVEGKGVGVAPHLIRIKE